MLVTKPHTARRAVKKIRRRTFPGSTFGGTPPQVLEDFYETSSPYQWSDTRQTENSPNWRRRIAEGLNATGTLIGYEETYDASGGYHFLRNDFTKNTPFWYYDETWRSGPLFEVPLPSSAYLSPVKADNQALSRFYSKARSAQTSLQGLVSAGEWGKTVRGIAAGSNGIYRGVYEYLNALRKGNVLKHLRQLTVKEKTNFIQQRWAETQLFIRPLASEVQQGAEALARFGPHFYRENDKFISGMGEDTSRNNTTIVNGPGDTRARINIDKSAQVRYYGKVSLSEAVAGIPDLTPIGFDSSNFLPTIWELIPYSFVIDYFTNIGGVVSAFSFNKTLITWSTRTVRLENKNSLGAAWIATPNSDVKVERLSSGSILRTKKTVNRSAQALPPSAPTLEFRIPGVEQLLNVASLVRLGGSTQKLLR
jgi:hypothetical protein